MYFDGRKDKTIVQGKVGKTFHHRTVTEEYVVIAEEPGSKYIENFSVRN
jgi:hypothetical protein